MSWGDLLRYTLLIAICIGALGLVAYAIRRAIQEGSAVGLLREVADRIMEIRAVATAKRATAREGKTEALKGVLAKYAREVEELNEQQKEEADTLKEDPVALSRFLVRAGRKPKPR